MHDATSDKALHANRNSPQVQSVAPGGISCASRTRMPPARPLQQPHTMKSFKLLMALAAAGALTAGCDPNTEEVPVSESERSTERSQIGRQQDSIVDDAADAVREAAEETAEVAEDTREAAQDGADYTYAQKDQFLQALRTQVNQLETEMQDLRAQAERASDEAKAEAQRRLETLEERSKELTDNISRIENATEENWQEVKQSVQQS